MQVIGQGTAPEERWAMARLRGKRTLRKRRSQCLPCL